LRFFRLKPANLRFDETAVFKVAVPKSDIADLRSDGTASVMYNTKDEQTINVFHAMKCRNIYLRLLKAR
jgi:hypothetical protein